MKYEDALKLKNESKNLIGTRDNKGFTVGEIIIVPSDEGERKSFFDSCNLTYDFESALIPFIDSELEVWALDLDYLKKANIVFYNKL